MRAALLLLTVVWTAECARPSANRPLTRAYRLGFSATPPRLELASVLQTIEQWTRHGDAALLSLQPPWRSLLADTSAAFLVRRDQAELVALYRRKRLPVVAMIDATDGLARDKEAPELVALGRSIREPAVQRVYREYVLAVDSILRPDYLALAMETNLIRTIAPADVYAALRTMTNGAAQALRAQGSTAKLYVSVQVETAWGRLPATGRYVGIAEDVRDFPFGHVLGLSAYPFLGGFADPKGVPLDYYQRLAAESNLPVMVVEGGWSSGSVPGVVSSPERQARWIDRQMELADRAHAVAVFQITFTDLDLSTYPVPPRVDSAALRAARTGRRAVSAEAGARQVGSRLGATAAPLTEATAEPSFLPRLSRFGRNYRFATKAQCDFHEDRREGGSVRLAISQLGCVALDQR